MNKDQSDQQSNHAAFTLFVAERWMLGVVFGLGLCTFALTQVLGRFVEWPPFLAGFGAALGLIAIGAYVRGAKETPRLALALIGVGIFMGFSAATAVFIFTLFPLHNPLIDPTLIAIDAALGYHWPSFVEGLASYPLFTKGLGFLYHTSLPQMVLTICLLAALGQTITLHRFLFVGMSTMVAAVSIWWFWPSIGPSGFQMIPDDVRLATGLYFNSAYGAHLMQLVTVGPAKISIDAITGVVAFPSYHMVMACIVVWFSRKTLLFPVFVVASTLMIPATLSHGGHHLIDLLAGASVFAICLWLSSKIIREPVERP